MTLRTIQKGSFAYLVEEADSVINDSATIGSSTTPVVAANGKRIEVVIVISNYFLKPRLKPVVS